MDRKNISNKDDMNEFKNTFFTIQGYDTLTNYLKNLILEFIKREDYPRSIGPVLGIPLFEYALTFKSEEELIGRIKLLGQILAVKEIQFETANLKIDFSMKGVFTVSEK